ncbi:MAG: 16S rRNA (adenine(1518)-N(6)/adenine(1519)-N(6))-dimethyltransferase RsmA [Desulfobulbaceae bacterium]|nr:16S rRNA (adenine(1518)-N(6)/adenine(1519)-N(6))-dimethyltransferase RsmA [Desulfobulbaceae bacterium]
MPYQKTRSILESRGLAAHKKLGQNFLVHRHTAERIVDLAGPDPGDVIVEVGVGLGALTNIIAARAGKVIGIEADSGIIQWHREEQDLADNVTLIHGDILKTDLAGLAEQCGGRLKILANLPYSISSPFLFRLIDHREVVDWAVVMLQKEVALRLMARPGTREYGVPSVLFAGCADIEPLMQVKPGEFYPRPRVDSMVVRITFHPRPQRLAAVPDFHWPLLKKIVNSCFGQRRKTLLNGLAAGGFIADKTVLADVIRKAGLDPSIRAENLSFEEFVELSRCLEHET